MGAFQEDSAGDNAGRAYIFYGGPAAGSTNKSANAANVVINGGASSDYFGSSVASAGDVNGDGYSDVMVGAYQAPYSGSAGPGRAYIFYGGQNLVGKSAGGADVILGGVSAGDQFGYSVASSGDVNGDGYSDVIVGSPQEDSGGNKAGRAYIFYGGGGKCDGGKLKGSMVELAGPMKKMVGLADFHEAPWLFKRSGVYYLTHADNNPKCNRLCYATSENPLGPWTPRGVYLDVTGCDTSHGSVVEFKGQWYAFYHNQALSGKGNLRSICVDKLEFNPDGTIQIVVQTK